MKSLAAVPVTVSDTGVVRDSVPEVAVSVTVAAPSVAMLDAVNVAVTELPVVALDGIERHGDAGRQSRRAHGHRTREVGARDGDGGRGRSRRAPPTPCPATPPRV